MKKFVREIMGTPYIFKFGKREDINLKDEYLGLCCKYSKEILVSTDKGECTEEDLKVRTQEVVAHEILHAYLNECGLEIGDVNEELLADFFMKNWRKSSVILCL